MFDVDVHMNIYIRISNMQSGSVFSVSKSTICILRYGTAMNFRLKHIFPMLFSPPIVMLTIRKYQIKFSMFHFYIATMSKLFDFFIMNKATVQIVVFWWGRMTTFLNLFKTKLKIWNQINISNPFCEIRICQLFDGWNHFSRVMLVFRWVIWTPIEKKVV